MQRKKRRSTLTGLLHSIPIYSNRSLSLINHNGDKHNKLSHVSNCSIPLVCMALLLLGGVVSINPALFENQNSYAVEVGQGTNDNSTDSEAGIAAQSMASPSIKMEVSAGTDGFGKGVSEQVSTAPGASTAYRSHNISVTGHNITHYQLTISGENLTSTGAGATEIGGANGATGATMPTNTWGYAWDDQDKEVSEMTYNTMTSEGQSLENVDVPEGNGADHGYDVDLKKKLVFGANFGADAQSGVYASNVTVSLTSTPLTLSQTWKRPATINSDQYTETHIEAGIDTMQAIDTAWATQYCSGMGTNGTSPAGIKVGDVLDLRDARDGEVYRIVKLEDGNCWMQQNLRLQAPEGGRNLTSADSDVTSDWLMPETLVAKSGETTVAGWSSTGEVPSSAYYNNPDYGVNYNWMAATAGGAMANDEATNSVCPRGWKLPTVFEETGSLQYLTSQITWASDIGWARLMALPYDFRNSLWMNADGTSIDGGTDWGAWWSRTIYNGQIYTLAIVNNSSDLFFNVTEFATGTPVRCVAISGYNVIYDANGGTNAPAPQIKNSTADTEQFTISGQGSMTNSGYTFLGWSTDSNATEADSNYAPGKTVTIQKAKPGLTLYAVWGQNWSSGVATGITRMQQANSTWASDYCGNASGTGADAVSAKGIKVGDTLDLKDSRDGQTYRIVKLEDGNCWMQENLRLVAPKGGKLLTSADSDVSNWTMPETVAVSKTDVSKWVDSNDKPYSAYASDGANEVYYNWTAATATDDSSKVTSGSVSSSICPSGWKLPTGNTDGQFQTLFTATGITNNTAGISEFRNLPYNFTYTGLVDSSMYYNGAESTWGAWWSNMAKGTSEAYIANVSSSSFGSASMGRYVGAPVRCVATH